MHALAIKSRSGTRLSEGGCRALVDAACDRGGADTADVVTRRLDDRAHPQRLRHVHRLAQDADRHHPDDTAADRALPSHIARSTRCRRGLSPLRPGEDSRGGDDTPSLLRTCDHRYLRHPAHRL